VVGFSIDIALYRVDALCQCIDAEFVTVYSTPTKPRRMGTSARAYVREQHSFEEIGSQYEALYDELLN